tara:strand:+ start:1076 stop:1276 length:201 start_codon:yes stop_codon:yes gene_type:complete
MKQKIKLLKMAWQLIKGNHEGWVFFRMNSEQQVDFLSNKKAVDIKISYVGVDKRVAEKIAKRIENS